ncbi:glycosyltransferase [Synechococcus sp. FGCU-3]|nr:glycosyltransferase [Synechococcus sp. FGCU3]
MPSPSRGNPGIGGAEYAHLAVVELLQGSELEPLLLLTAPQSIAGIQPDTIRVVTDLVEALRCAEQLNAPAFVFRPGALSEQDWMALEATRLNLLAWFHNLGCLDQARTESLQSLRAWVLLSGAQLDAFRHSRLARRARVIPNPVAVPRACALPRPWDQAQATHDLAYVGAITPFKGFDRLASQWGGIAAACPETRLLVFGGADLYGARAADGQLTPYERHCRGLLAASGHGNRVDFLGSRGLERYDAMASVAVGVVNPSGCDETFCLSAAEFSACGIPVVTARRHVLIQTVRDGQTGLLARNDQELASHCIALLQDPERAWQLGQAGQAFVAETFGADRVRQGWINLVRDIANGTPVQAPAPSTPWHHEQRWLRQLWGSFLLIPGWPSWPTLKAALKRLLQGSEQAITPGGVAMLSGLTSLLVWALVVFGKYGGNPTGLARIGDQMLLSPRLQGQELVVLHGKRGNDGQQFLALALDPLQADPGTSAAVDNPIYRGKRLLYPLLAWLIGLGQPQLIVWAMGLINVACIGLTAWVVARWAQLQQLSPQWGLAVLALPSYWITLSLNTADLLATTLMLTAALAWHQKRLAVFWVSLTGALLSRETALLAWAATGLTTLWERRWRWLLPLALAPVPLLALTASLKTRFAATSDGLLATLHFGPPGLGTVQKVLQLLGLLPLPGPPLVGLERGFDGLCLLFWLATLIVLVSTAVRGWGGRWLRLTAALYLLPALCTSTQILARFPDYTRVWIDLSSLALLALLSARSRWLPWWLGVAAVLSVGYGVGFGWLT